MTRGRVAAAGLALAVAYAAVVAVTVAHRTHHVLPLYDSIGSTIPPYHWVRPPALFKAHNQKPAGGRQDFTFSGAAQQEAATDDAQLFVTFLLSGLPRVSGASGVRFDITPLDSATLGPVPHGFRPDGNAYRVVMTYRPSGAPVGALAKPGNVFISYPTDATRIGYSADGQTWNLLKTTRVASSAQVGAEFNRSGYYEAVAPGTAPLRPRSSGSGIATGLLVMAAVAFVIFTPLLVAFIRRRPGGSGPGRR